VNEVPLTGESSPVRKNSDKAISPDTALADRVTAVFAGATVIDGQGKAIVTSVGDQTELGRVAGLAAWGESEPTPLQKEMDDLAKTLAFVPVGVSLLIPWIGLLRGFDFQQMVLTWLSLTFLMLPGQPPIIVAMALALVALELARKGVIVRKLNGAETLGSVNVILSDKTGMMTENQMTLTAVTTPLGEKTYLNEENGKRNEDLKAFLKSFLHRSRKRPKNQRILQYWKNKIHRRNKIGRFWGSDRYSWFYKIRHLSKSDISKKWGNQNVSDRTP
jgi:Ca2+-transporting ATPase